MARIGLERLRHTYQARPAGDADWALKEIDIQLADGGAYALLGPSGCGKTTLLNIVSGLLRPTAGRVLFGDVDVTEKPPDERNIAQVFQFPVVYDTMTVYDNLAFPLRNRGLPSAEIERRIGRIAEALELTELLPLRATGLTADHKQILALGRGLVRDDVAAILFDEPLTVIDPHRKWLLRRKLKEIHRQFHHTLIYVTHDQTEALTFADEVVVMQHGQVLQRGTPEELFRRPAHTYVGYFIGSPGMNIIPCELLTTDGRSRARIGAQEVILPPSVDPGALAGTRVELGIRPEHIAVLDSAAIEATWCGNRMTGAMAVTVTAVEDHGRFRIIAGWFANRSSGEDPQRIKIRVALDAAGAAPAVAAGAKIHVHFPPQHVCLYSDHKIVASGDALAPAAEGAP